jgi:hypothetical protein
LKSFAHKASADVAGDWVDTALALETGLGVGDCVGGWPTAVVDGDVEVAPQPIAIAALAASATIRAALPRGGLMRRFTRSLQADRDAAQPYALED